MHVPTRSGIMAHSYSSLGIQNMLMNGKPVGEIETRAALRRASCYPSFFWAGYEAAVADLSAIVPQAGPRRQRGLSNYTCISLSAQAARTLSVRARRVLRKLAGSRPAAEEASFPDRTYFAQRFAGRIPEGAECWMPARSGIPVRTLKRGSVIRVDKPPVTAVPSGARF